MTGIETFRLPEPEMEAWGWVRDPVHGPNAVPPMVGDVLGAWFSQVFGRRVITVNGYLYLGFTAPTGVSATYEQAPQSDPAEAWFDFYVPRVRAVAESLKERDWGALDVAEIRAELDAVLQSVASAFASTMAPLGGLGAPIAELVAFCARHFEGDGEARAMTLVQGEANATSAIGERLEELADEARALPAVAAAVRSRDVSPLDDEPAAKGWLRKWNGFLEEFGSGNQTWFQFHDTPWIESPAVPLSMLARALDGSADAGAARRRSAEQREEMLKETLAALPGETEQQELQVLLHKNQAYVAVIEDRARWQLVLAAAPRAPILAAGRKLAAAGAIDVPGDVFYLHLDELGNGTASFREAVTSRKAAVDVWKRLSPPDRLGAELRGIENIPTLRQQFGYGAPAPSGAGRLEGFGTGGGVITAVARVLSDVDEGHRLAPGEVLVCRSTSPPWTPLFGIAGGVVTESGGVLSHAAIAAREYGLPAVVGAREATHRIPDGALVTVDGTAGTVTWDG